MSTDIKSYFRPGTRYTSVSLLDGTSADCIVVKNDDLTLLSRVLTGVYTNYLSQLNWNGVVADIKPEGLVLGLVVNGKKQYFTKIRLHTKEN